MESITGIAKVTIQIGDSLYILSGSDVSVNCIARGTPPPVISWRWNGREVTPGERRGQLIISQLSEGSRLTIKQLTSENAGQYECVAKNTGGADRITSSITVLGAFCLFTPMLSPRVSILCFQDSIYLSPTLIPIVES